MLKGPYPGSYFGVFEVKWCGMLMSTRRLADRRRLRPVVARVARRPGLLVGSRHACVHRSTSKTRYFFLYTVIDIYSRYTVGWMIAASENKDLAEQFLSSTIAKYPVEHGQLTIHSGRGSPMIAHNVAQMLSNLGVTKSHSRPKTSNDNPYSESQYKTLKYRHGFPDRFGCIEDARAWCAGFFDWYNLAHRHSGIAMHAPFDMYFGLADQLREMRADTLDAVYQQHPERFVRRPPEPPRLPEAAWINKPTDLRHDDQTIPTQR